MARGRKPALTLDEQLKNIEAEIEATESKLKELKQSKKDVEEQIVQEKINNLQDAIAEKGITIEQAIEIINKK